LDGEKIRAFFPGKKAAKKPAGEPACNEKTNNLRLELERRQESFRAKEKPQASRKNKLVCFSVCPAVFPCALCAQQGQLRWPARKRWATLLFQVAIAAFTALKEGFLLLF